MAGPVQKGHATATLVLGICELLCGILIIILAIVASSKANVGASLSAWWAGVVFAIPGILGIIVGCTKNNGVMIAFMVLNIIAFVLQGIGAILAGVVIAVWTAALADVTKNCTNDGFGNCKCYSNGQSFKINGIGNDCSEITSLLSVITAMMVFLVIAAIIALTGSILGCIVVCCSRSQPQGGVVLQQQQQPQQFNQAPPAYYQPQQVKQ